MKVDSNKVFDYNGVGIKYYSKYKVGKELRYLFIKLNDDDDQLMELTEKEVKQLC